MPTVTRDGVSLFYDVAGGDGGAAGDAPTVAFVETAGLGAWSWGWQHRAVAGPRSAVVYDQRGTGRSDAPAGPYDVATLAADLEAVLGAVGARRAHVVGLGLGALVALQYARDYGRASALALVGAAASGGHFDRAALADAVAPAGDAAALRASLDVLLSPEFRERHPEAVDAMVEWRAEDDATRAAFDAQVAALDGFDASGWLHEVTCPALVLHGGADRLVPASAGRELAGALPRGRFRAFEGAGHLVGVERARPVNDALVGFLEGAA